MMRYRINIEPDDNDTLLVTSDDIPIVTFGDDRASAIEHAHDAVLTVLAGLMGEKLDIPLPDHPRDADGDFVDIPLMIEMKLRLYAEMRKADMRPAQLQNALGWQRESVDRLFRLKHASKVEQLAEAFHALGKDVELTVRDGCGRRARVVRGRATAKDILVGKAPAKRQHQKVESGRAEATSETAGRDRRRGAGA